MTAPNPTAALNFNPLRWANITGVKDSTYGCYIFKPLIHVIASLMLCQRRKHSVL
jgi:hypothetical protein